MTGLPIDTNLLNPDLFPSAEGPPHAAFDAWRASDPVHQIVTRIPDFRISGEVQRLRSIWFDAITKLPVQFTPEHSAVTQ